MMARDTRGAAYGRVVGAAAALLAAALLAAGCGGGTTKAGFSAATTTTSATSGSASTGGAPATNAAGGATTTTTVAVAAVKSGSLGSSFCNASRSLKTREDAEEKSLVDTPAAVEKVEKDAIADLPEFQRLAPSSLKSAVEVLVAEDRLIFSQLQAVNFDYSELPPSVDKQLQSPQFTQAEDQITSYLTHVCGISPNS
jgi:hypothetical protein